jgi:hypothetical protein
MPALTQVGHAESVYFTGSVGEHPFPEQATSFKLQNNFRDTIFAFFRKLMKVFAKFKNPCKKHTFM